MKTIKLLSILVLFVANTVFAQDKTKAEKNIRDLFVVMDAGQTDRFAEFCSPDFKIMNPFLSSPMPLQAFQGIIQGQKSGFPDLQHEVVSIVSDGKNVITKGIFRGTNMGSFMGMPPTGNKVAASFLVWDEMDANNKLKFRKVEFDAKGFEAQLMAGKVSAETIKKNCYIAYESLNKRDFAAFKTVCTPDFTELSAGPMPTKGIDAVIEVYKSFMTLAPDIRFDIKKVTVDGDRAFVETTVTGTNTGMVMGMLPPTGKRFKTNDIDIVTLDASGKATSHSTANPAELLRQIGYGYLENPNFHVVSAIYAAFGKGDVNGILANINEKVTFDVSNNPGVKNPKVFAEKSEIPMFFKDLTETVEVTKFEPYQFASAGDNVFAAIKVEWKNKATGKMWASNFSHHFKLWNGKVSEFRELTSKPTEMNNMTGMNK